MPCWPPARFTSWSYDENNGLILFRIPEQIKLHTVDDKPLPPPSLSTLDKLNQAPRTAPILSSLPAEIQYTIFNHLGPVDRVCLALTCRRLCASVLAAPRLTPESCMRFTNVPDFSTRYWNANATCVSLTPEYYQLCQRLAHGWVDKRMWRYCWKCNKILPRDEDWWWKTCDLGGNKRIQNRRNPRWSNNIGVGQTEWADWSRRRKLRWIVHVWSKADWEDSSVLGCDWCRERFYIEDVERMQTEHQASKNATVGGSGSGSGSRNMDATDFVGTRHPVECPSCLERELTYSWRPPKRVVLKRLLCSTFGCLRDWSIGLLWCVGSVLVATVMFVWECSKWVIMGIVGRVRRCTRGTSMFF